MSRNTRPDLGPDLGQRERDFVFAVAMKIVKSECDAEDVAQDALLLAHRHRRSFRGQSKYSTWLYRVATTAALMHLRSKARKTREVATSQLDDADTCWVETLEADAPGPERELDSRQQLELVQSCIAELGSKYLELLHLRWFEGYSEREISERMQLPLSTVKTRSFRGRRHVLSECGMAA